MKYIILAFSIYMGFVASAQVDTVNTKTGNLVTSALKEGTASYAVYFTDSLGNRISSADIWDRSIRFSTNATGEKIYTFNWKWYSRDSLRANVTATGNAKTLTPLTHMADYGKRGTFSWQFANNVVTVAPDFRRTAKDSAFNVVLNPPGFEFPMDLEIFPLLPFKKVGQKFAIAFYEPGGPKADYYQLTVTGKEDLALPGNNKASCWLLRIDYRSDSYATFWIAEKTRDVLKMQEYFRGRYRYKVRLY